MEILSVKGDVVDVARESADAVVLWIRDGFNNRFVTWWFRIREDYPGLRLIDGQAQADKPWHSLADSVWDTCSGQRLRYLYVFSNPDDKFGFNGVGEVGQAVDRSLSRLARLGARAVAFIHMPIIHDMPPIARQDVLQGDKLSDEDEWKGGSRPTRQGNLRSARAMVQAIREWDQVYQGKLDRVLLVDLGGDFSRVLGPENP